MSLAFALRAKAPRYLGCAKNIIDTVKQRGLGGFPHERLLNPVGAGHFISWIPLNDFSVKVCTILKKLLREYPVKTGRNWVVLRYFYPSD
jgi:hypothetical protein